MITIIEKIYVFGMTETIGILIYPKIELETIVYLGKNGLTTEKIEGDGKTPKGEFKLGTILSTSDKEDNIKYTKINKNMYWVDDPNSKHYNKLVDVSKTKIDWNSAEHLIDFPTQYEYLIEIKTNPQNIPNKGSAIFLHCSNRAPTNGCIAIDRKYMKKILENVNDKTKIVIK